MAGHLGAAVVAGYFFGEDVRGLPPEVYHAIERELERIMRGEEAVWFDSQRVGITVPELFQPVRDERHDARLVRDVAKALSKNIGRLRQWGHNVILAAIALRTAARGAERPAPRPGRTRHIGT